MGRSVYCNNVSGPQHATSSKRDSSVFLYISQNQLLRRAPIEQLHFLSRVLDKTNPCQKSL